MIYFPINKTLFSVKTLFCKLTKHLRKLVFLTSLMIFSMAHAGEIEEGIRHFRNGEYDKAAVLTQSRKTDNNAEAQYCVGIMHRDGLGGVEKHEDIAAWWLEKAAVQNYMPAQYALAQLHAKNKNSHSELQKAFYWYEQAAKNGHPLAQYKLAEHIMSSWQRTPEQTREAIKWYELSARHGQALAANKLAHLYDRGKDIPKDQKQARYWAETSAKLNDPEGMSLLGNFYIQGTTGPADIEKGLGLITKAARTGDPDAQYNLAEYYRNLDRSEQRGQKALDWYTKAGLQNHEKSVRQLISVYRFGLINQPVNDEEAEKWQSRLDEIQGAPSSWIKNINETLSASKTLDIIYRYLWTVFLLPVGLLVYAFRPIPKEPDRIGDGMLQYEKGQYETAVQLLSQTSIRKNPEAQTMLGELYANGLGVEKNIGMAIQHLSRASDHNSHAAFLLGTLFEKGDDVPENLNQAIRWYKRSAKRGDKDATNRLGILLATGKGIEKNPEKARQYFEKSVQSGLFKANANLAWLYHCGIGTCKDELKAFMLTSKAAAKKCPAAQYNLALSYRYGFGTEKDNAKAMKWYRQSALCGQGEAILALIDILQNGQLGEKINMKEVLYWQEEAKNILSNPPSDYLIYPENPAFV